MKVRAFITHKLRENYSDCQDRFSINVTNRCIAVSDGMSQSVFPDYWAEILSAYYAENGHCTKEDLKKLCPEWLKRVEAYKQEEIDKGKNPWRLDNNLKAKNGAGATICGVRFENEREWIGHVLGDSCIIEIGGEEEQVKEIHTSEEKPFDSYPDYYESFEDKEGRGKIKEFKGRIDENNSLLLVSDPFSEFLSRHKNDSAEWLKRIKNLHSHDDFLSLVDEWRQNGLHNDDSTICIVEYDGKSRLTIEYQDIIQELIAKKNNSIVPIEPPYSHEFIIMESDKGTIINSIEKLIDRLIHKINSPQFTKQNIDDFLERIKKYIIYFFNDNK